MEAQMRIILFLMVIISSATEEVKKLTSTEGGSITLPDPVKEKGYLLFERTNIAAVNKGEVEIEVDIYISRLHWDKNNGNFTITGLQRNDSGIYTIDSKKGRIFTTSYKLTVYESVSTPAVKRLSVSAESCILLCSVEKAEETTLLWYKDKEILNQSSSALSLPLTVHKQDSNSSYRCVAANPADNKTLPVNITTSCNEQNDTDNSDDTNTRYYFVTGIIISIMLAVFVVLIAIITKKKCLNKTKTTTRQTQDSVNTDTSVNYTDVQISGNRPCQAGNLSDSPGTVDRSNLTTVYDKLEAHRMLHTDTAENVSDKLSTYSDFAANH
ncbi:uncharacterized protein LOC122979279 isoform X2 [Thunnus albacares]|uniref:uncharacterized protein LOC122979279 isoform X2 n=1 Tax=Thunnus albacares TaxID=8236 RepID=UPI001CF61B24|nr:uncharacterized protein LOC122979279 isoform X2 [Thunnus albacares]